MHTAGADLVLSSGAPANWAYSSTLFGRITRPRTNFLDLHHSSRPFITIQSSRGHYDLDRRRSRRVEMGFDESRLAPPHAGLIWLFGPGRFDHLLFALRHHLAGGGASHCWLVMQDTKKVQETFSQLHAALLDEGVSTKLHRAYVDRLDVESAYATVRTILEREVAEENLDLSQVIADITGGTKPLTAGMVLAALTLGASLEYVESERDPQGDPIPNTLRATLLDTTFYVERGEELAGRRTRA